MTRRALSLLWCPLLLAWVLALALPAGTAHADDDQGDREIVRYDIVATAQDDGTIDVRQEIDLDFRSAPGHGLFLTLVTRQEIADDPDHYRVLTVSDVEVSSPSGAPADLEREDTDNGLVLRIGDEDIDDVSGVQTYVISYTLAGVPSSNVGVSGEDEIFWNIIGSGFEVPIRNVTVELTAPAEPIQLACATGRVGSKSPCDAYRTDGSTAYFEQGHLDDGEGLSIASSYPPGTFGGVEPILEPRKTFANVMGVDGPVLPISIGLAVVGIGAVAVVASRKGRDEAYLGLTPGVMPTAPGARVGPRKKLPVAVRFTPPDDVLPGELGTLTDEVADRHDVTATLIDLAVRGYLRIEEVDEESNRDWRLIRDLDHDWDSLRPFERSLLRGIFSGGAHEVRLSSLGSSFAETMDETQGYLYDEMVQRGWFARSPKAVRGTWMSIGFIVVVVAFLAGIVLALTLGAGLIGVAVLLIGVVMMATAKVVPARTAAGTAVLAQALGFKRYIETAELDKMRFEAEQDIFSAYLPYAMAFGLEDRWVGLWTQAAEAGQVLAPSWYIVHSGTGTWSSGFGEALGSFTSAANLTVGTATVGSSGGSGFSSGVSVGGGVGGGGGGGW